MGNSNASSLNGSETPSLPSFASLQSFQLVRLKAGMSALGKGSKKPWGKIFNHQMYGIFNLHLAKKSMVTGR